MIIWHNYTKRNRSWTRKVISWRRFQAFDLFWLVRYDMTFIISSKRIAGKLVQTVSYYFLLIDGAGGHVNKQVSAKWCQRYVGKLRFHFLLNGRNSSLTSLDVLQRQ